RGQEIVVTGYKLDVTYFARHLGNAMWFASNTGTSLLAGEEWFLFRAAAGLPSTGGTGIAIDDDGYAWVSTVDKGVFRSTAPIDVAALRAHLGGAGGREVMTRVFAPA